MRYQSYQLEKAILKVITSRERLQDASLYLLLTEELCHHGSGPAIRDALKAGVKIVQLREKNMDDGRFHKVAKACLESIIAMQILEGRLWILRQAWVLRILEGQLRVL